MKTKVLKKYPIQVLMMTVTFLITMVLPVLMSYLIDNILESGDMLYDWFGGLQSHSACRRGISVQILFL